MLNKIGAEAAPIANCYNSFTNPCMTASLTILAVSLLTQMNTNFESPLTCKEILSMYDRHYFIPSSADDAFIQCYRQQQQAVGSGTFEECKAALEEYIPQNSPILKIADAIGGKDAFCRLPVKTTQETLQFDEYNYSHLSALQSVSDSMRGSELSRGVDGDSLRLFVASMAKVTTNYKNVLGNEKKDTEHGLTLFQKNADPSYWSQSLCKLSKPKCYHLEMQKHLNHEDITDFGKLQAGETICKTDNNRETCVSPL